MKLEALLLLGVLSFTNAAKLAQLRELDEETKTAV